MKKFIIPLILAVFLILINIPIVIIEYGSPYFCGDIFNITYHALYGLSGIGVVGQGCLINYKLIAKILVISSIFIGVILVIIQFIYFQIPRKHLKILLWSIGVIDLIILFRGLMGSMWTSDNLTPAFYFSLAFSFFIITVFLLSSLFQNWKRIISFIVFGLLIYVSATNVETNSKKHLLRAWHIANEAVEENKIEKCPKGFKVYNDCEFEITLKSGDERMCENINYSEDACIMGIRHLRAYYARDISKCDLINNWEMVRRCKDMINQQIKNETK